MSKRMQILNHKGIEIKNMPLHVHINPVWLFKRTLTLFLILLSINLFTSINSLAQSEDQFVLVIDAGHGGKDSGTRGVYSKEKDIALAIALKFGSYVEKNMSDVKVIFTRKKDVFIELHERANIANTNRADLFISIHVDGVENKKVYGTSTFVMGLHKNDENLEVAKRENAVIVNEENYNELYAGFDPASPESYIRISLEQNAYLDLSLSLAAEVQAQFETRVKRKSRGVKQAGFLVLWRTTMPSVLVETGFLTNSKEEKFLNSSEGQDYMASAIYRAFKDYKSNVESKSSESDREILAVEEQLSDSIGIVFRVQIASSVKQIDTASATFKGIQNIAELKVNNVYKYTVGCERDYDKILKLHKEVKLSIKDAFVVSYKDGMRVPIYQARKELK